MRTSLRRLLLSAKKKYQSVLASTHKTSILRGIAAVVALLFFSLLGTNAYLIQQYTHLESPAIEDRNGVILTLEPNSKQQYGRYVTTIPARAEELLVQKEDRFFYWHPGINPVSLLRAIGGYLLGRNYGGGSTISQQLAKNLLGNEQNRSVLNKIVETFGAFSLELCNSKERILTMYANSVYMGNQVFGLDTASTLYFGKSLTELDDTKVTMLLATISSPSTQNPWMNKNAQVSRNLALRVGVAFNPALAIVTKRHDYSPPQNFELSSMHETCESTCTTTLDSDLTDRLRKMLNSRVQDGWDAGARSGAIVVIKLPENEILALVGTPDVQGTEEGQQINMTIQPRAIGSTVKPLIYLEGYRKGLRPYTLVNDREYKFPIGSGFPLYPKNYDGVYHGWITLHTALSNSLNVPSVKTLQYIGLDNFYDFLEHTLGFVPEQDLDAYQYGIALGALEMDPLTLAQYLSIFPNEGVLKPFRLFLTGTTTDTITGPMSTIGTAKRVADPKYTQLVTKVLNDRLTGVPQFGLASSLNLSQSNYAVKTGTSRDFHDSWTVGYTPDFLVVVWYGNPKDTALKQITGQTGAGTIWHDAMEMLMNSPYNKKTAFDFSEVRGFPINGSIDFGLAGDVVSEHRDLLPDTNLIISPQAGDTFLKEDGTTIPLISNESVSWYANDAFIGEGERVALSPSTAGDYTITATDSNGVSQRIIVHLIERR